MIWKKIRSKNRCIQDNDPLGHPTVLAGSDCRLILKFLDGRTDGRTLCVKIVITIDRNCGSPRGSIFENDFMQLIHKANTKSQ